MSDETRFAIRILALTAQPARSMRKRVPRDIIGATVATCLGRIVARALREARRSSAWRDAMNEPLARSQEFATHS